MAVTKTDFINFTRCRRYSALEEVKKDRLDADISYEEYKKQEIQDQIKELVGSMFELDENEEEVDLTEKENAQLKAMMPYYKQVEMEAGRIVTEMFWGTSSYAESTRDQVSFEYLRNGIRYLCYIDIYNEVDDTINIVEVKATTNNNYMNLVGNHKKSEKYPIFKKDGNIFKLKGEIVGYPLESEMPLEKYEEKRQKLFDKYGIGKYIYDLAIQRFIIEGEYKNSDNLEGCKNINYYLAVLNKDYIFDGEYIDGKPNYKKSSDGEELITLFDMTEVTREYQSIIDTEATILEGRLFEPNIDPCPLGVFCKRKKTDECKYLSTVCGKMIPPKNSSLNYLNNGSGFLDESGERVKGLEIINRGYYGMLDVPESWITSRKHELQRECLEFKREYINKEKLKAGLSTLKYPIYHLDFETFPCPLPRFKGEFPYIQSPFEYSLHIEYEPGVCDKLEDNFVFLCKTHEDEREELVKTLVENIKPGGTMFAQNVGFEKSRIKELSKIFPEYKERLMEIYDKGYDLLWLVNTNSKLYEGLGFNSEEAKIFNYYNSDLSGSFSIKKTLPVFSDLSYKDLVVKNGTEAIVVYANYPYMQKEEFNLKYQALIEYCRQDTWAMVVILEALRKLVN